MNNLQPAIEAQDLGRRFGRYWALAHVALAVPQGDALLLAGPNGSGKTTFAAADRRPLPAHPRRAEGLRPRSVHGPTSTAQERAGLIGAQSHRRLPMARSAF